MAASCWRSAPRASRTPATGSFPAASWSRANRWRRRSRASWKEELDITLRACERWHIIEHDYPHAYVRLHFCKVTAWDGALRALEGQDFAWQTLPISVDPVLPATLPVFEWMRVEAGAS